MSNAANTPAIKYSILADRLWEETCVEGMKCHAAVLDLKRDWRADIGRAWVSENLAKTTPAIYCLHDPNDDVARYIGKALDPRKRLVQHMRGGGHGGNIAMMRWVDDMNQHKETPRLEVLERCDWADIDKRERAWIRRARSLDWPLLNICDGGSNRACTIALHNRIDDWWGIGKRLRLARRILLGCECDVSSMVRKNYVGVSDLRRAVRSVDKVRCELDDIVCNMFPELRDAVKIFYGRHELDNTVAVIPETTQDRHRQECKPANPKETFRYPGVTSTRRRTDELVQ